ncbi:hypothetical protein FQ707_04115 [Bacteroidaceae bacterium HV4-6-C5C]|nr:hypothetical protein FQ707_04115 [Bacteroidaceae bacterium HV4-6-C5C]
MKNISIKELIESCIADLMNNQPLSTIFLKVQTVSFCLKNDQFKKWFYNERNGYQSAKDLPNYRKTVCQVFGDLNNPFKGIYTNYHIPVDQIKNETVRELLINCSFCESIIELESIATSDDEGSIRKYVPGIIYGEIQKLFSSGHYLDAVWQTVSRSTIVQIVESVKSKLLQFFLEMDEQLNADINFDIIIKKREIDKIVNQTINTGIYVSDNATVNVSDSTLVGGQQNNVKISMIKKKELEDIVTRIEVLSKKINDDEDDIADAILSIREELENKMARPKFLKVAFNSLKAIGTGLFVNEITPLVDSAIKLLNDV